MDSSAFAEDDTGQTPSEVYERLPEEAQQALHIGAFLLRSLTKISLLVLTFAACAAAFVLLIQWICLFWLQTKLLLLLSTFLRHCYTTHDDRPPTEQALHAPDQLLRHHPQTQSESVGAKDADSRGRRSNAEDATPRANSSSATPDAHTASSTDVEESSLVTSSANLHSSPFGSQGVHSEDSAPTSPPNTTRTPATHQDFLPPTNTSALTFSFTAAQLEEAASFAHEATRGQSSRKSQARRNGPSSMRQPTQTLSRHTPNSTIQQTASAPARPKALPPGFVPPHLRKKGATKAEQDVEAVEQEKLGITHGSAPGPAPRFKWTQSHPDHADGAFSCEALQVKNSLQATPSTHTQRRDSKEPCSKSPWGQNSPSISRSSKSSSNLCKGETRVAYADQEPSLAEVEVIEDDHHGRPHQNQSSTASTGSSDGASRNRALIEQMKRFNRVRKFPVTAKIRHAQDVIAGIERSTDSAPTASLSLMVKTPSIADSTSSTSRAQGGEHSSASGNPDTASTAHVDATLHHSRPALTAKTSQSTAAMLCQAVEALKKQAMQLQKKPDTVMNAAAAVPKPEPEPSTAGYYHSDLEGLDFTTAFQPEPVQLLPAIARPASALNAKAPAFFAPSTTLALHHGKENSPVSQTINTTPLGDLAKSIHADPAILNTPRPLSFFPTNGSGVNFLGHQRDPASQFPGLQYSPFQQESHIGLPNMSGTSSAQHWRFFGEPVSAACSPFVPASMLDAPKTATQLLTEITANNTQVQGGNWTENVIQPPPGLEGVRPTTSPSAFDQLICNPFPTLQASYLAPNLTKDSFARFNFGTGNVGPLHAIHSQTRLPDEEQSVKAPQPICTDAITTDGHDKSAELKSSEVLSEPALEDPQAGDEQVHASGPIQPSSNGEEISRSTAKKRRRAARMVLQQAWWDREKVRARVAERWSRDGVRSLEYATETYNMQRDALAKCTSGGELMHEDALAFPLLSKTDMSVPMIHTRSDDVKKVELARGHNPADPAKNTAMSMDEGLDELHEQVLEARDSYEEACKYLKKPPPAGRANIKDLRVKAEARISLAAARYRRKREALAAAYPNGLPEWLEDELCDCDDAVQTKF